MRSRASFIGFPVPLGHGWRVLLRCLLVDDNPDFLASADRLLRSQGMEIVGHATTGAEALELAKALTPDLALVDVELGDEDGIRLTRDLETQAPSTRIVLVSAYEQDDLADLIAESGAAAFLPKNALSAEAIAALLCPTGS